MTASITQPTVVVVDDEPVLLAVLTRMLARRYRVLAASNLTEAVAHLEQGNASVLLTDLRLHGGERGETLIERYAHRLPCLAMTAFGDRDLERQVLAVGAVGYLSKPFGSKQLLAAVAKALGGAASAAPSPSQRDKNVGIVFSGGGVRAAYEAGVVQGITEVLNLTPDDPPPVKFFVGTSVGALNATWLAAHAHRGDLGAAGLVEFWSSLEYRQLVQVNWAAVLRRRLGRGGLRIEPVARLLRSAIDWARLHANIEAGNAQALIVPALDIVRGHSALFAELAPGVAFRGPLDPHRRALPTRITPTHLLAAIAIPGVFPAQSLGGTHYVDGGLSYSVPIAPALRVGATRLVLVSGYRQANDVALLEREPSWAHVMGKVLNAQLLGPLKRDLQNLERFNQLWDMLEQEVEPEQLARVGNVLAKVRGQPYRKVESLMFQPSDDIGLVIRQFLDDELPGLDLPGLHRLWFRHWLAADAPGAGADWAAYALFDGTLARRLAAFGRADARARAEEIRAFFGSEEPHGAGFTGGSDSNTCVT